jgi:heptose-I-phosphate ethanolaminephosphotransferase
MSFLWLIPILLFPKYSKVLSGIIGFVLWCSSLMTMGYLMLYGQDFSQSVLFIMFESNVTESKEFLESYFSWWMVPTFITYSLIPYLIWRSCKPLYTTKKFQMVSVSLLTFIIIWPAFGSFVLKSESAESALSKQRDRMEAVAPWHLIFGYQNYKETLYDIEQNLLLNKQLDPIRGLYDLNADTNNTLVLVIGESTNRQKMSLYGYGRDTTPLLNELKNELLVFDNVYAPRPYTIETLQQVLTFADQENPDLFLTKPTMMNMMKQAGYKTYWITNQQTQTKRNTMLTTFSKQADEQVYLNNNRLQNSAQYDGVVLEPFKKVLNQDVKKKFIVVHLLGTHRKYNYRYPETYEIYNGKQGVVPSGLNDKQAKEYNEYDNSVRYNDYVVANLIKLFKDSGQNGFLTYFSDHGEEVYDIADHLFAGRNEAAPSSHMYTIPFIIWRSDSWMEKNPINELKEIVHRANSLSDFIYTWSDLSGIQFEDFDPSRSIINPRFTNHPIWIGDPANPKKLRDLQVHPFEK